MPLIAIAVYDTDENRRASITAKCIRQLKRTASSGTVIGVYNNASCDESRRNLDILKDAGAIDYLYHGETNIGTAKAINYVWKRHSTPDGMVVKMDNDCFIRSPGWIYDVVEVFNRCPDVGLIALKRIDLAENPCSDHDAYKSTLSFAMPPPDSPGYWLPIEDVNHAMGTCHCIRQECFNKVGYLYQMDGLYGFDDSLMCLRVQLAGFRTVFLPHVKIDHLDVITPYVEWKREYAGSVIRKYTDTIKEYKNGAREIYYNGE